MCSQGLQPPGAPAHAHTSQGGCRLGRPAPSLLVTIGGKLGRAREGLNTGIKVCRRVCVCVCARVGRAMWQGSGEKGQLSHYGGQPQASTQEEVPHLR